MGSPPFLAALEERPRVERTSSPSESGRGIGLRRLTLAFLTLSFVTISWNGVYIGGFQPGDLILAPTAAAAVVYACQARQGFRIPKGLLAGAALIGLAGVLSALFPPTQQYLNSRYSAPTLGVVATSGDLTQLFKFEIALVVIVVIVGLLHPTICGKAKARKCMGDLCTHQRECRDHGRRPYHAYQSKHSRLR